MGNAGSNSNPRRWRRVFSQMALIWCVPGGASAMTGAELLQTPREVGEGYVLGVTELYIGVYRPGDQAYEFVRPCVLNSGANAGSIYDLTLNYLRRNPADLQFPAFGGILKALGEMCPSIGVEPRQ